MVEMPQDPVNASQSAAALEPLTLAAWPARETIVRDGWVMRFTDGYTHRGNSVATFEFKGRDLDAAIEDVEREYRRRGLPAMFQIASHAAPDGLAAALAARGYVVVSPSYVRAATPANVVSRLPVPEDVALGNAANGGFMRLVLQGSHSEADGRERLDILSRISLPLACVTALEDGHVVACGMGVCAAGKVGVNMMRTGESRRRRGHALRVLAALARWSVDQGASELYLSVEMRNAAALALYARAGFEPAYSYRYFRKELSS